MATGCPSAARTPALGVVSCHFDGFARPFPYHFHEHFVFGLVESGGRILSCRRRQHTVAAGSLLLLSPGEPHACQQGSELLHYRCLQIPPEVIRSAAEENTESVALPEFVECVVRDADAARLLLEAQAAISGRDDALWVEECVLLLASLLLRRYGKCGSAPLPACREEIAQACAFMRACCTEHLSLEQIGRQVGLSKSAFLRAFAKEKGTTPHRYLTSLRVSRARRLLEEGIRPAEVAALTGFADQSHLTNSFRQLLGVAPGYYQRLFI